MIKLKNATMADKKSVRFRYTKMDHAIVEVLLHYGFLKKVEVKGRAPKRTIEVLLNSEKAIEGVKFESTPSLRRYAGYKDFASIKGGRGLLVVSTPKGIKAAPEARKEKVGGQLLFAIW